MNMCTHVAAIISTTAIAFSLSLPAQADGALPANSTSAETTASGDMSEAVRRGIEADPELQGVLAEVSNEERIVTLSGKVASARQRDRAVQRVLEVDGIRGLDNRVEVGPES